MAKTNTGGAAAKKTTAQGKNTSATASPVMQADVSSKEAGLAPASQEITQGAAPATPPESGSVGNSPLPGGDLVEPLPPIGVTAIVVTSQREGFRRAGRAWSKQPVTVSIDEFSEAQIEALVAEPMLTVVFVGELAERTAG